MSKKTKNELILIAENVKLGSNFIEFIQRT